MYGVKATRQGLNVGVQKRRYGLKYLPLQPYTFGIRTAGNRLPRKITRKEEVCAMCRCAYKIQPDSS